MSDRGANATPITPPIDRLIEHFPELFDCRGAPPRGFDARHSRIDEFPGRGNQPPVIVKTITVSCSPEHAAQVAGDEFAALAWLRARLGAGLRDTIPEPLAWIPGTPAMAMRKLEGVTLGQLLRRYAARGAVWGGPQLTRIGEAVGGWLRALHDATRAPDAAFDNDSVMRAVTSALNEPERKGLNRTAAERVGSLAGDAARRLAGTPVVRAARQGDFTVSNILIDGTSVRIVDFENFGEADAVYEDVASLSAYLRMLACSPVYARPRLARMRQAFLATYGQRRHDPVFALYELKHALAILAHFPESNSALARYRRRAMVSEVVQMAESLDVEVVRYKAGAGDFRDASSYDAVRYRGRANEYKRQVMKTAYTGLVGSIRGLRVLDVGCGTGRGLADLAGAGARVFGSDASVDMLAHATRAVPGARPQLAAAHAQHLPFSDASFDAVVSLNFLHLFSLETQRQMIAEMKRVVKPGGRLVLEFDNALHGVLVGPLKRWTGREQGSLPGEIRRVIGSDCQIERRRGAVYPVVWRVLARVPRLGAQLEKLLWVPGLRHLAHRVYYEVRKPAA